MTSLVANTRPGINRKSLDNSSVPSAVRTVRGGHTVDVGLSLSGQGQATGNGFRNSSGKGESAGSSARFGQPARPGTGRLVRTKTFGRSAKGRASGKSAKNRRVGALLAGEAREDTNSEEYDTDFESDASSDVDIDGRLAYISACKALGVAVLPRALAQWSGPCLNLNYRNLAAAGAKALASVLNLNPNIQELELQENRLGGIGAMYIATHLKDNVFITKLNLTRNNLGSMGALAMGDLLCHNNFITHLNLADNNLRDSDGEQLAKGIEACDGLKFLDLSHNNISEDGATKLGKAIGKNISLQTVNMSWNQLRRKGAVAFCAGVKRNTNVTVLDLAWNGLGYEGSLGVGEMLRGNHYLRELDVTSNRINWEGATLVARGLAENDGLEILKIGHNPLTMTGCMDLLEAIDGNKDSVLSQLNLEGVPINRRLLVVEQSVQQKRPFEMPHGGVVGGEDVIGRRPSIKKDPIQRLMDFLTDSGIRPVDLFRQLKQDDRNMVSKEAFIQGLQMAKAPLQQYELEQILDSIELNKEGKISFNLIMKGVKEQIKVNREEEKRRLEQENKFNRERKRLMNLSPLPDHSRNDDAKNTTPSEWLYDDDFEDDHELDKSAIFSPQSRPAPAKSSKLTLATVHSLFTLPAISKSQSIPFSRSKKSVNESSRLTTSQQMAGSTGLNASQRFKKEGHNSSKPELPQPENWSTVTGHKFGTHRERPQEKSENRLRKPQRLVPIDPRAQTTARSLDNLHEGALLPTSIKVDRSLPVSPNKRHNQLKPLFQRTPQGKNGDAAHPAVLPALNTHGSKGQTNQFE